MGPRSRGTPCAPSAGNRHFLFLLMVPAIGKRHQEFEDSIKCVRIDLLAALQLSHRPASARSAFSIIRCSASNWSIGFSSSRLRNHVYGSARALGAQLPQPVQ